MAFDTSHQFTYHPGGGKPPQQPLAATNPWTNPQPTIQSTKQSDAWDPWTNPPAPIPFAPAAVPSSNTSHHYVYQPVSSGSAEPRQQPPACSSSFSSPSNWTHYAVYSPSSAGSTSPAPMYYPGGSQPTQVQFHSSQPAAEPANFNYYQGLTAQQINDRNVSRAQNHGGFNPVQLIPQNASPDNEYYCRELDGTYTVRSVNTIMNSLNPGQWAYASTGYPYWVRHSKD